MVGIQFAFDGGVDHGAYGPDGPPYVEDFVDVFEIWLGSRKHNTVSFMMPVPVGVQIHAGDKRNPAAAALQRVLKALGIDAKGTLNPSPQPDTDIDLVMVLSSSHTERIHTVETQLLQYRPIEPTFCASKLASRNRSPTCHASSSIG